MSPGTASGAVSCTIAIGATASPGTAVTYPVGRFPAGQAPHGFATANVAGQGAWATVGNESDNGMIVFLQARAAITGAVFTRVVNWFATL
jgi:hypothetical protein